VQLFGACRVDGRLYLVTEFLPHCLRDRHTLQTLRQRGNGREGSGPLAALADVARALAYLHSQGVVHRDVKARNVMLTGDLRTAKLIDFGLAVRWDDSERDQLKKAGTKKYRAPEVDGHSWYGGSCDTFSLGITVARVMREYLWQEERERRFAEDAPARHLSSALSAKPSEVLKDSDSRRWRGPKRRSVEHEPWYNLAQECVGITPKERPTAADCAERLISMCLNPELSLSSRLKDVHVEGDDPWLSEFSREQPFASEREAFIRRAPAITAAALESFCDRMDFAGAPGPGALCPDPVEEILFQPQAVEKKQKEGREHKRLRSPVGEVSAALAQRPHRPSRKKLHRRHCSPGKDSPILMDAAE